MPQCGRPATAQAMGNVTWTVEKPRDRSAGSLQCVWRMLLVRWRRTLPTQTTSAGWATPKTRAGRQTLAPLTRRRRDARARAARSRWTDPSRMKARRCADVLAPDQEHPSCASEKTPGEVSRRVRIDSVGNRSAKVRGAPGAAQCDVARDRHLLRDQGRPTSWNNLPWRYLGGNPQSRKSTLTGQDRRTPVMLGLIPLRVASRGLPAVHFRLVRPPRTAPLPVRLRSCRVAGMLVPVCLSCLIP